LTDTACKNAKCPADKARALRRRRGGSTSRWLLTGRSAGSGSTASGARSDGSLSATTASRARKRLWSAWKKPARRPSSRGESSRPAPTPFSAARLIRQPRRWRGAVQARW